MEMGYSVRFIHDGTVLIVARGERKDGTDKKSVGVAKLEYVNARWRVGDAHIHVEADSEEVKMLDSEGIERISSCEYFGEDDESGFCYFTSYPALRSNAADLFRTDGVAKMAEYLQQAAELEAKFHSK